MLNEIHQEISVSVGLSPKYGRTSLNLMYCYQTDIIQPLNSNHIPEKKADIRDTWIRAEKISLRDCISTEIDSVTTAQTAKQLQNIEPAAEFETKGHSDKVNN